MGLAKEFREFATRGNVVDLAVGVVVGAAFGKIVTSFVNDVVMPLVNPAIPGGDWRLLEIGPGVKIGSFAGTILDFIIVSFSVFIAVKAINRMKRKQKEEKVQEALLTKDQVLLTEIRDLLRQRQA